MEFDEKGPINEYGVFSDISLEISKTMKDVYKWMLGGLVTTGVLSVVTEKMLEQNPAIIAGILPALVIEVILVFALSFGIRKMSGTVAKVMFVLYSVVSGITLGPTIYYYTGESVFMAFFYTALLFGALAFLGTTTNKDLTKVGNICITGLWVGIIASILNVLIFRSTFMGAVIDFIIFAVFVGVTAYDVQKIKRWSEDGSIEKPDSIVIIGALTLYLDFINIFLKILRFTGKRRN